mgnify:CR=1 FL=1
MMAVAAVVVEKPEQFRNFFKLYKMHAKILNFYEFIKILTFNEFIEIRAYIE